MVRFRIDMCMFIVHGILPCMQYSLQDSIKEKISRVVNNINCMGAQDNTDVIK